MYARGRVVSVLEGGYSELSGLVDVPPQCIVDADWWNVENLDSSFERQGGDMGSASRSF